MNRKSTIIMIIAVATLFSAPSAANAGDFWDFLKNAWENIQSQYFQNDQTSANTLENEIMTSATQAGAAIADPNQYDEYAVKLAKTLGKLTPEQQARIFGD